MTRLAGTRSLFPSRMGHDAYGGWDREQRLEVAFSDSSSSEGDAEECETWVR
jgi:hypothetical protein